MKSTGSIAKPLILFDFIHSFPSESQVSFQDPGGRPRLPTGFRGRDAASSGRGGGCAEAQAQGEARARGVVEMNWRCCMVNI